MICVVLSVFASFFVCLIVCKIIWVLVAHNIVALCLCLQGFGKVGLFNVGPKPGCSDAPVRKRKKQDPHEFPFARRLTNSCVCLIVATIVWLSKFLGCFG